MFRLLSTHKEQLYRARRFIANKHNANSAFRQLQNLFKEDGIGPKLKEKRFHMTKYRKRDNTKYLKRKSVFDQMYGTMVQKYLEINKKYY